MKRFLKFISVLSVFCLLFSLCSVGAFAIDASGTYGEGIEWNLSSMGTLTISGNGEMADKTYSDDAPWGKGIKEIIIRDGITKIGNCAFSNQSEVWRVIIPETVKSIGDGAFYNCSNLKEVTMPKELDYLGEFSFALCASLGKIDIPEGIEEIKNFSFSKCQSLSRIDIPDSVVAIRASAFFECEALKNISFGSSLEVIENNVFFRCNVESVVFNRKLKKIDELAFAECHSLYSVDFPDSLLEIGDSAFYDCYLMKTVSVPKSVEKIGSYALGYKFVTSQGIRKVEGFFLEVEENSAAHKYALEKNFPVLVIKSEPKLPESDSDEYMDEEGKTMPNVKEKTTASDMISKLSAYGIEALVFDKDENLLSDGSPVGTGCVVALSDGSEYTVSVKGDVDGTGIIDSTDYLKIKLVFLGSETIEGVYFAAADADENAEINSTDYLRIKSYFLGDMDLYA